MSSPSKAVDVLAWLDAQVARRDEQDRACGIGPSPATTNAIAARAAVAEWHAALMAIAASRIESTGSPPVPDLTAEQAWNVARAALSTIGESQ